MRMKYLKFKRQRVKHQTGIWLVENDLTGADLGVIKWYSPWRQYCFEPSNNTVFARGCLTEIVAFTEKQMAKRKRRAKATEGSQHE